MTKTKNPSRQKRANCREVSREFSFLCVLCGSSLVSNASRKTLSTRSAQ